MRVFTTSESVAAQFFGGLLHRVPTGIQADANGYGPGPLPSSRSFELGTITHTSVRVESGDTTNPDAPPHLPSEYHSTLCVDTPVPFSTPNPPDSRAFVILILICFPPFIVSLVSPGWAGQAKQPETTPPPPAEARGMGPRPTRGCWPSPSPSPCSTPSSTSSPSRTTSSSGRCNPPFRRDSPS